MDTTTVTARRRGAAREVLRVPVHLWLVIVLMAMSFGAGVIVRTMAEPVAAQVAPQGLPQSGFPVAPPLTDQEIQQGLPTGHPGLTGATGSTGGTGATGPAGGE